ncbi:sensor histidine kinase [Streptomyces spiramenti]|uniref:Sensor histidine kinase n=1 Tax=Streptomyces spiramenti TaxID=2720606 RepID=A0ABX1AM20_9ACTN|nr:sensor histidine kinase [Streptomyces spiramenti]NJP65427.1 sensor histidine kinase [Streptomyces spiramenti]
MTDTEDVASDASIPVPEPQTARDARPRLFLRFSPPALLGLSLVLSAATSSLVGMDGADWVAAGALAAAALFLQLWWDRVARGRPGPGAAGAAYYALRSALAFGLAWLNPFCAFFAAVGCFDIEQLVPRRWIPLGLLATAATVAGAQIGGLPPGDTASWVFYGMLVAANMGIFLTVQRDAGKEEDRSRKRVAAIRELEHANLALERALVENAALHDQLLLQAREAGIADERRRLAAEIHDTVAQDLTGVIAQLQVVTDTREQGATRVHVERALHLARHSLGEARRAIANLAPVALAEDDLPEALEKTVVRWSEHSGVKAEFTLTGSYEPLHEEVEATLLRIAAEALSNTARHATAGRVGVTLSCIGEQVVLDVRDDGRGFDLSALPERDTASGFGLEGMRARAERLAGELTVESEPGLGTAVSARVPSVPYER